MAADLLLEPYAMSSATRFGARTYPLILPFGDLIDSFCNPRHGFADDNQLYVALPIRQAHERIVWLEEGLLNVQEWLTENMQKGNPTKTESKLFGSQQALSHLDIQSLSVAGIVVQVTQGPVRSLGILFD
jgi:hypothetical protein